MRIVAISDTHMSGREISVPDGDVLVHAGDHTFIGDERETYRALQWLDELPHKRKVLIAGNHDWFFDPAAPQIFRGRSLVRTRSIESMLAEFPGLTYLCDSGITIDGVTFYGSPWQPRFEGWAFNFPAFESSLPTITWGNIPSDVNVLVTHGPPHGILDEIFPGCDRKGDVSLLRRLDHLAALRLHIFGHIHESYGVIDRVIGGRRVTFVNASINTGDYRPTNAPIDVYLSRQPESQGAL
jgi:calcineurin-like phosphoesterase family protein